MANLTSPKLTSSTANSFVNSRHNSLKLAKTASHSFTRSSSPASPALLELVGAVQRATTTQLKGAQALRDIAKWHLQVQARTTKQYQPRKAKHAPHHVESKSVYGHKAPNIPAERRLYSSQISSLPGSVRSKQACRSREETPLPSKQPSNPHFLHSFHFSGSIQPSKPPPKAKHPS